MHVSSSAFKDGQPIPKQYTGDGVDVSPPLRWDAAPSGTKSLAVMCYDPDAPVGTWYHWLLFNLSPKTTELKENFAKTGTLAGGAMQGTNDFDKVGYNGPAPPRGATHHYHYRVFALNAPLSLNSNARKEEFLQAIKGHTIGDGETIGTYRR